jgi:hypothetical protein
MIDLMIVVVGGGIWLLGLTISAFTQCCAPRNSVHTVKYSDTDGDKKDVDIMEVTDTVTSPAPIFDGSTPACPIKNFLNKKDK